MEYNEFSWERQSRHVTEAALSVADIKMMAALMIELREVTLSRKTYAAATDFLRRFGVDADASVLVQPDTLAN